MNCKYCGKPIKLVPSAKERAEKFGGKPSDYIKLFPYHAYCVINERTQEAKKLMKKTS